MAHVEGTQLLTIFVRTDHVLAPQSRDHGHL